MMNKKEAEEFISKFYHKDWLSTYLGIVWENLKKIDVFEITDNISMLKRGDEYTEIVI